MNNYRRISYFRNVRVLLQNKFYQQEQVGMQVRPQAMPACGKQCWGYVGSGYPNATAHAAAPRACAGIIW